MRLFHFMKAEYGLKVVRERRLKIARIDALNDPFEFLGVEVSNQQRRAKLNKAKATLSEKQGLLCFSKNWHDPVQWAHYANNHSGLCLAFDLPNHLPSQICYVNSRFKWSDEIDESFVQKLLLTKFAHWSYEEEYRVYTDLEESEVGLYYADFSESLKLSAVIVGAKSSITRAQLAAALGDLHASVETFKARPAFRSFRIVRNKNELMWT